MFGLLGEMLYYHQPEVLGQSVSCLVAEVDKEVLRSFGTVL
jgi:hypothetical protein